jgi:hypothetical protein
MAGYGGNAPKCICKVKGKGDQMRATNTTPPKDRGRLPTAAEADEMAGHAFAEAFHELREEKERKNTMMTTTTLRVIGGPCVPGFHGPVARVVELPTGGARIERWVKGAGWTEAPEASIPLADFIPGFCRSPLEKDAARLGCRLEDFGPHWTEMPGHPWDRAKIISLVKERAWAMAAARVPPGHG